MKKWSDEVWAEAQNLRKKILEMPFITELMDGSLDQKKFIQYIHQDNLYLANYIKVLSGIIPKLDKQEHRSAFLRFCRECIESEVTVHDLFLRNLPKDQEVEMSPTCMLYTSFLVSRLADSPLEVIAASILPCFCIYKEVGDFIVLKQSKEIANPYQELINLYGSKEFAESVEMAIAICDDLADQATESMRCEMTKLS